MNTEVEAIKSAIEPLRQDIITHPVYPQITDIESLHGFMQQHVYAVWDFMSLLKSLQNSLTCTTVPWFPVGNAETRYLINEIVVGEESDVDAQGNRLSHFELYLQAMRQIGASTAEIETFIAALQSGHTLAQAFDIAGTSAQARAFVNFTFDIIHSGKPHLVAAVFTFGREDLIPGMFISLVNDINAAFPDKVAGFKYYLERHIEVDGDHHSHLALQMTANLCGNDTQKWAEAREAVTQALHMRKLLWDGVMEKITAPAV